MRADIYDARGRLCEEPDTEWYRINTRGNSMTKAEAEALVQRIAQRFGSTHQGVSMYVEPGLYKVVVTHRASNRQFDVTDPLWGPFGVPAA